MTTFLTVVLDVCVDMNLDKLCILCLNVQWANAMYHMNWQDSYAVHFGIFSLRVIFVLLLIFSWFDRIIYVYVRYIMKFMTVITKYIHITRPETWYIKHITNSVSEVHSDHLYEFLDPQNLVKDTKIKPLSDIVPEILLNLAQGGHFGRHLGFLPYCRGDAKSPSLFLIY